MTKKYFSYSLLLHSITLLTFIPFTLQKSVEQKQSIMTVTLVEMTQKHLPISSLPHDEKPPLPQKASSQQQALSTKNTFASSQKAHRLLNHLLMRLHSAIAAEQHYPEEALAAKESGRVSLGLQVAPDGQLTDITVTQSSGHFLLDQAALAAAKAASPVLGINHDLLRAKHFTVDVIFE